MINYQNRAANIKILRKKKKYFMMISTSWQIDQLVSVMKKWQPHFPIR